jgi:holo-[acyl-carrier protein] synthase
VIGVDVIEIGRMRATLERAGEAFLRRAFTPAERARAATGDPVRFLASAFAAKEAVFKALALDDWPDGFDWPEIEIGRDAAGRPTARLLGEAASAAAAAGVGRIDLSISYETDLAIAVALVSPKSASLGGSQKRERRRVLLRETRETGETDRGRDARY